MPYLLGYEYPVIHTHIQQWTWVSTNRSFPWDFLSFSLTLPLAPLRYNFERIYRVLDKQNIYFMHLIGWNWIKKWIGKHKCSLWEIWKSITYQRTYVNSEWNPRQYMNFHIFGCELSFARCRNGGEIREKNFALRLEMDLKRVGVALLMACSLRTWNGKSVNWKILAI